jgi:hypothetical protein
MEFAAGSELNYDKLQELLAVLKDKLHILDEQLVLEIKRIKESL